MNMEPLGDELLADVDAWLRGLEGSASLLSPVGAARSPSVALALDSQPPKPRNARGKKALRLSQLRVKPMNSTQRRKEELEFLRAQAEALGRELRALKRCRASPTSRRGEQSGEGEGASTWRGIAKRQWTERTRAERENERLLKKLQEHIKLTRAVEKLLSKYKEDSEQEQAAERWSPTADRHSRSEMVKLRQILQSVESHCPLLHVVLQASLATADGGYVKLNNTLAGGISMEMRHNKTLPFRYIDTGAAARTGIRQGTLNFFPDVTVIESTADTAMIKLKAVLPPVLVTPATVYQVIKWFRDADGEYAVWEMSASTGSSADAFPPLDVTVRGWASIRSSTMLDGSLGSEVHEFAMLTAIESSPGHPTTHSVRSLSERIAAAYQEKHQLVHQTLENLLLDTVSTDSS